MRTQSFLSLLVVILFLLVGAPAQAKDESTANINIAFLTDLSGSMKTNQLVDPTKAFLTEFIQAMYTGDRVILMTFGDSAALESPFNISERNRDNDIKMILAHVEDYQFDQNYTYTSSGLSLACLALSQQVGPKVLVLLTDGKEEIPPGQTPAWDQLPQGCSGIAIHVVALTDKSMPTVKQVGDRLHATVHDATKQSLAQIGEDIRKNIRVFVETVTTEFKLGNLTPGSAAEMRTEFKLTGASSQIELKPVGSFPDGVEFACANFQVPGEMRCQLTLVGDLKPGNFSGSVSFEPTVTNLAVVTPKLQVEFSRGLTNITASEDNISLGAMRPGESTLVSVDFESNEPMAQPETITLTLSGLPADVVVTLEPSTIQVPSENVQLTVTFVSGNPGTYSGQLAFSSQNPTVTVSPAAMPVEFKRRTWYWENWRLTVPGSMLAIVVILGAIHFGVIKPRRDYNNRPLLQGRLEIGGSIVQLDSTRQTQVIEDCTFRATGTKQHLDILVTCSSEDCTLARQNGEEIPRLIGAKSKLKHGDKLVDSSGTTVWTYLNLNAR